MTNSYPETAKPSSSRSVFELTGKNTEKQRALKPSFYVHFLVILLTVSVMGFSQTPGILSSNFPQGDTLLPRPCEQHFLIVFDHIPPDLAAGKIDNTFKSHGFTRADLDLETSTLRLTCPKGCGTADVKSVVDELNLKAKAFRQEYSNRIIPKIFE
ncbi:MAG: hypothetical protein ACKOKF_07055 [Bacteroidota bacterium]